MIMFNSVINYLYVKKTTKFMGGVSKKKKKRKSVIFFISFFNNVIVFFALSFADFFCIFFNIKSTSFV